MRLGPKEVDARDRARAGSAALMREALARIEQLKGKIPRTVALDDAPLRHRARRRQLHLKASRRDDDEPAQGGLGRPEHAQHACVKAARNPHRLRERRIAGRSQHRKECRDDRFQCVTVAFDGPGPVHGGFSAVKNIL
jgi:hypothetical protein